MDVGNTEKEKIEKVFLNEVLPIIEIAKLEAYKKVKFIGEENNSIDAIIVDTKGQEVNFECTTAIDYYTHWTLLEYLKENNCLVTGPHSEAKQIKKNAQVENDSNIYFYRKNGERNYIESKGGEFEDGVLWVSKYVDPSIEKILSKIKKGDVYKNFSLILTIKYGFLSEDDSKNYYLSMKTYWENQDNNPFKQLYIAEYDSFYNISTIQNF